MLTESLATEKAIHHISLTLYNSKLTGSNERDKSGVNAQKSGQSNIMIEGTNGLLPLLWDAHELEVCIAQYLEHVLHEIYSYFVQGS